MNFETSGGEIFRNLFLESDRFNIQVGLGGVKFLYPDGRVYRQYPLNQISRWSLHLPFLTLFVKTPSDLEERPMNVQGEERVVRSMLDTLTSCCMQMAELLDSQKEPETRRPTGASSSSSVPRDPASIAFWSNPEKAGWLQCQGEHMRTWRRRWFVLKNGFLFRFMDGKDVKPAAKPRGILNLHKATDIGDGRKETSKPNSIRVVIENQPSLFIADSETETVEWMSALEGAMHAAVKATAGVHEPAPAARPVPNPSTDLLRTLESSFRSMEPRPAPARPAPAPYHPPPSYHGPGADLYRMPEGIVQVTGYDGPQGYGGGGGYDDFGLHAGAIAGMRPADPAALQLQLQYGGQPQYAAAAAEPPPQAYYGVPPTAAGHGAPPAPQMQMHAQMAPAQQMQVPQMQAPAQGQSAWQMFYTAEGKPYYFNASTGTTQWEPPSSFL